MTYITRVAAAALLAALASSPANATTVSCVVSSSQCTGSLGGTATPNHVSITVSDTSLRVAMCDAASGSCIWRTCTLNDDGSARYQSMQRIALTAQVVNALNYGRLMMQWDTAGKCQSLNLNAP